MKRIAIVDHYRLLRQLLATFISDKMDATVQQFDGVDDFVDCVRTSTPFDAVLIDPYSPRGQALADLALCVETNEKHAVVLFTRELPSGNITEVLQIGVKGFISKTMMPDSVLHALQFVLCGEIFIPASLAAEISAEKSSTTLSVREREVLKGVRMGMMNKEIATQLSLTEVTIKMHVRRLCLKLGVKNRTQLALVGSRLNLS